MPFDPLNPFSFPGSDPFGLPPVRQTNAPALPPLSEEEKAGLLERIGKGALSGVSYIAGALNKPGRAVRGLLGGTPREALNLIPFSDALGLTNPEEEVRGSHILHSLGLTEERDPSLISPEGAAGFGLDVLTDPLTYITGPGAALTKAGIAAKKAGVLPYKIADRIAGATPAIEAATGGAAKAGDVLGGHIGIGFPGFGVQKTFDLAPVGSAIKSGFEALPGGKAISSFAGSVGGAVRDLYNQTIPPLFQRAVGGQTAPAAQQAYREFTQELPGVQAAARKRIADLTKTLPDAGTTSEVIGGMTGEQAARVLQGRDIRQALESNRPFPASYEPAISGQREYQADLLKRINETGRPDLPLLDQGLEYAPRQGVVESPRDLARATLPGLKPGKQLPGREEILKGLPTEGAGSINELTRRQDYLPLREAYNKGETAPLVDAIKKNYMKVDDAEIQGLRQQAKISEFGRTPPPDMDHLAQLEARAKQAEHLADWVATSVPQELAQAGLGFFDRHPHVDLMAKAVKEEGDILKNKKFHQAVASMAEAGPGTPLDKVLKDAGLTLKDANGDLVAMTRTLEVMKDQGKVPLSATLEDLKNFSIPENEVDRLVKFTKAATAPAGLKPFLDLFDSVTNLTKAFQTTLWPANWVRNQGQALFQNWVNDAYNGFTKGPMKYAKPFLDAKAWRDGRVIEGAHLYPGLELLSEESASNMLREEIQYLNVHTAFKNPEADILGGELTTRQLLPDLVGQPRKPFSEIAKSYLPTSKAELNPLGVAGFRGRTEDVFAPIKAGRELNQELEGLDRVSVYLAKRSQGYSPESALAEVRKTHFDYANMSDFEKGVMRRVIPFYNFARQNVPAVITELAQNPGGKLANTIRAASAIKGAHPGFIPGYIGEGVAAPIGEEENGTQRFLTHLGLGFEDLGQYGGPGGPLGTLNPLIKAPIEQITGRQLFTGRDLSDLHSRLGDITGTPLPVAENIIQNSPLGRFFTTAGTLADPRKSVADKLVNTLTGARLSDVDVDKARAVAIRDYITESLRRPGVSHFDSLSVRPENLPMLSPLEQQLYRLYRSQEGRRPSLPSLPLVGQ